MYTLTYPAENFDEMSISKNIVLSLIKQHRSKIVPKIKKNMDYYDGKHAILRRKKSNPNASNVTVVCNHAKEITDTATGYFLSTAISFKCNDSTMDLDKLTDAFDTASIDEVDHDIALDMSRCGCGYEYSYAKKDKAVLTSKGLDPLTTFIVYDDTIEQEELFAVYYDRVKDDSTGKYRYDAYILTDKYRYKMCLQGDNSQSSQTTPEPHYMGEVPITIYQNNKDCIGDYEQQIGLIDAYNTLMSDRINDKVQFLDALLVLYGARLADDADDGEGVSEITKALKVLHDNGYLEMPTGAKAEYITRTFDEQGIETLRKALKEDIYAFSHVPNLTDENFAGTSSGVAMEYKLLGLENITSTKQRYHTKGLKKRIRLYCNYLGLKNIALNPSAIMPVYTRGLPKNILELSQIIGNLKGSVSQKTLITQLPFVEDADGEIKAVKKENKDAMQNQQSLFSGGFKTDNEPPEVGDEDDKDKKSNSIANRKTVK